MNFEQRVFLLMKYLKVKDSDLKACIIDPPKPPKPPVPRTGKGWGFALKDAISGFGLTGLVPDHIPDAFPITWTEELPNSNCCGKCHPQFCEHPPRNRTYQGPED